jgi:CHAT domain-containing protein
MDQRIQQLSGFLYSAFIRPIEGDIAGASRLVIVQQNDLTSLPLHALRKWPAGSQSPYVAEQFLVSYLPSASALMLNGVPMLPEHDIVALGHAGATSWDVEYELRDIRAFYKDARFYFNQDATLAALQKEHGDVLHLAAEFHFDGRIDQNSYFVLSDGKSLETTRRILLGDVCTLQPFSTTIVSDLGERRTGIHKIQPTMFLLNGSASVIVSPYPPLRKTKKYFGEIFYTSLLGGNTSQQAFRQTQIAMIKNPDYASPHVWAPFFLWGK